MTPHDYLNLFTDFETRLHAVGAEEFTLERIKELLRLLGDPQKDLKIIHVAGTKGKGSTCAFISHILAEAGYTIGLYTSPHLHTINERIRIVRRHAPDWGRDFSGSITDAQLEEVINAIRGPIASMVSRGLFLTYFEVLTVAALYFFKQQKPDWVVLETGLGGRLDATNAVDSLIAVLTPISLDHTKILGSTVTKITGEKTGIIKNPGQQVVVAPQGAEASEVILNRCAAFGIVPVMVDAAKCRDATVALKGSHQKINAATAVEVIGLLRRWGSNITAGAVEAGLKNTRWAGRFEALQVQPHAIIADGAHNVASAKALAQTVQEEYPGRAMVLVLGVSADKDVKAVLQELLPLSSAVILTKASHPRARAFARPEAEALLAGKTWFMTDHVKDALDLAQTQAKDNEVIVVTGSMFVVAEARGLGKSI